MNEFVKEIASTMKESKTKAYDTVAKVLRIDEKTAYVHIDGGADETPTQMAINCKTGDTVKIRVSGGKAWITGNITAPPTDDSAAEVAQTAVKAVAKSYDKFASLTTENFKAVNADIEKLNTKKLDAESADIKFANIDFSNIGKAAMEYFYAQSGLIKDVVVGDQKITGHLIGVTISGDLIEGNTVKAEKLVVLGEDGLYYKLNVNALGEAVASSDAKYQNGLDGSVIIAKSVTAEKVSVKDLVAFGATIGGLNITDDSLYSGVKNSINNTTQGFYLDKNGQLYLGDAENFLRYYKAKDGTYKLAISAKSVTFGSNQNLEEAWEETKTSIESKIETVDVEYYLSTSATSLSGGSWSTTAPAWTDGKYMWMRTKITDGAGNVTYSPDENGTCIAGATGATGATGSSGKGIASIVEEYYQSTSATSLSGGSWSTVAPTWTDGKYIWTRSVITYTDTTVKITEGICATGQKGEKGEQGIQGPKGATGATSYFHIKYSSVANPTSSSQLTEIPSTYIGTYVDFTPDDSTDPKKYTWSRFEGVQGPQGEQGIPGVGVDGKTSYLHIAYANSSDGKTGFSVGDSANKMFIGQYTDFSPNDSTDPSKYKWTLIKGATGAKGADGRNAMYITVSGTNYDTAGNATATTSYIIINGTKYSFSPGRGHTLAVINPFNNSVESIKSYDTYVVSDLLEEPLNAVETGKIICLFTADASGLSSGTRKILLECGSAMDNTWDAIRATHVFIGMKGLAKGNAYEDFVIGESGTRVITAYYTSSGIVLNGQIGATGPQGPQGVKGNGIESTNITYQAWSNGTSIPSGAWTSTPPDTSAENPYLWTKTVITYTDGSTSASYSVGSTIKGVDVGGINLIRNGAFKNGRNYWTDWGKPATRELITLNNKIWAHIIGNKQKFQGFNQWTESDSIKTGDNITFSARIKGNAPNQKFTIGIHWMDSSNNIIEQTWHEFTVGITDYVYTWTTTALGNNCSKLNLMVGVSDILTDYNVYFTELKLEKGNIATNWTPALEDVDSAVDNAAKTATNFMKYEDGTGLIVGDMRGDTLGQNTLLDSSGMAVRNGNSEIVRFGTAPIVITNTDGDKTYEGSGSVMKSGNNIVVSTQQTNSDDVHGGGKAALEMYYDKSKDNIGLSLTVKKGSTYTDLYESIGTGLYADNDYTILNGNTIQLNAYNIIRIYSDAYTELQSESIKITSRKAKCTLGVNNILWDANTIGYWMNASHKFTLNEPISEQLTGAVFVWSHYSNGACDNWWWTSFFVPKQHVAWRPGDGMLMCNPYYGLNKYIYIGDTFIQGADVNQSNNAQNGMAVNNQGFVLRYVLGV